MEIEIEDEDVKQQILEAARSTGEPVENLVRLCFVQSASKMNPPPSASSGGSVEQRPEAQIE